MFKVMKMTLLKRLFKDVFPPAVMAGVIVGIAGTINLTQIYAGNKELGAFLFSCGLLLVCVKPVNLFTGKIGYVFDNKPIFIVDLIVMILGNAIGSAIIVLIVKMANVVPAIDASYFSVEQKLSVEWWQFFGLAIMCGVMMYLAVEGYKRVPNDFAKVVLVILCAMIFMLAGFEHSIADIFYFMLSGTFEWKALLYVFLGLLGNAVGSIGLYGLEKWAKINR